MISIQCLTILLALLLSPGAANVTLQPFNKTWPMELSAAPIVFAVLRCGISANFELNSKTSIESRWNIATGAEVLSPGTNDGKYVLSQGDDAMGDLETLLIVQKLIYSDAGIYTCRARDNRDASNRGPWVEAQAHLQLLVGLATGENQVSVFDNATEVSLSCEMFLYLRPDEDLQWFRGGQLITSGSGRHSITYTDGSGLGQFGGDELGSSRVSTLVISQLQTSDSGTYTCAIRNTQHSQDLQLTVESNGTVEDTPSPSSNTPSATPTPSDSVSTQSDSLPTPSDSTADSSQLLFVYIGNGAALLIIVVVMTVVVLCIALMLFKKGNANKLAAVNLASDVIPEEGHHFNADIMTEDNVAYETKPPFNKGGAKQPTSLDPVYEIIPEERGDSEPAAIMLEANMAYERKPVLNEGEANQPDTVDIVYEEIIPEERQDSRPAIVLETNLAYETKPEDSIMLEANQAYEERQDSRADIMTEDNPAYEGPVIA